MFLTDKKLERRIKDLKELRYRELLDLEYFLYKEDLSEEVAPKPPTDFSNWESIHKGAIWSGRDKYLWIHKNVSIPNDWEEKKIIGIFDYGSTGGGNNSGFESLLYINNVAFQAVDSNHTEVFIDKTGDISLTFRLWSGLEGGGIPRDIEHRINRCDLGWLDEYTDDLYYLSSMILETINVLPDDNPDKHELRYNLDKAFKLIDWSYPGSTAFYESIKKASLYINSAVNSMNNKSSISIKCVGHTHIDLAWLWRLKHTREKSIRSFTTVIKLMESYPEYIFLQTQPYLYEYIKKDDPELYEKIKAKVTENRWEVDGAMWVEADCNLISGESMVRQILIGSKFIEQEFGKKVKFLWLPDVFGYSWAMPQILKKSGIDMFMTTKISWNQYNRMPHDTFYWKGIDGSTVLTHFITTPEPWGEPDSWFYTYNGMITAKTVQGAWKGYRNKNINKELLISYGYGDGGGGVNRDHIENMRRLNKIPGMPKLETSTAADFFNNLKNTVESSDDYIHTWDGELYLEYHRGTYTSHGLNKYLNRKMEFLYRETEWLALISAILRNDLARARQVDITDGWKIILTNQFHDIIPGSSINEVYKDSKKDYELAENIANSIKQEAINELIKPAVDTYTVINNSNWLRSETIKIKTNKKGKYIDNHGTELSSYVEREHTYVTIQNVPPMGFSEIYFQNNEVNLRSKPNFIVDKNTIETPFYIITLNNYGHITRLYDKQYNKEILKHGDRANVFQIFEDKPLDFDAWDIDIFYQEKMREVKDLISKDVSDTNSLCLTVSFKWKYMSSDIEQDMIMYTDNRRIDFKTKVNYREKNQLIKAAFPVNIRSSYATYDIQYGNVRRATNWNTSWDMAKFETVAHRWVDLSESNYGVSLLNDCKYGHDIKDNMIRITLLKGATHPDYLQDQGEHLFTYSLLPHRGSFIEGETAKQAFYLNQPLQIIEGALKYDITSFINIDDECVELDAIKLSEDKNYIVLRLHEYTGGTHKVNIDVCFDFDYHVESDLMERPISEHKTDKKISLIFSPYEIKTILIKIN